jgi:hypothetical protein
MEGRNFYKGEERNFNYLHNTCLIRKMRGEVKCFYYIYMFGSQRNNLHFHLTILHQHCFFFFIQMMAYTRKREKNKIN